MESKMFPQKRLSRSDAGPAMLSILLSIILTTACSGMSNPSDEQMIGDAHRHLTGKYGIEFVDATVHRPRIWPEGRRRLHVAFKAGDAWRTPVTTTLHYDAGEAASPSRIEDDYWTKTLSRIFDARWRQLSETVDPAHLALRVSEYAGYTAVPERVYPFDAWADLQADAVLSAHGGSLGFALEFHAFPSSQDTAPRRAEDVLCRIGDWPAPRDVEGVDITWFVYRERLPAGMSPRDYMDRADWSAPGPAVAREKWRLQLQHGELGLGCEKTRAFWRRAQRLDI